MEPIPAGMGALGARFMLVGQFVRPEAGDTATELRAAVHALRAEGIDEGGSG